MVSRGFGLFLAFLRIACGLSLLLAGLHKLSWFAHPPLEQTLASWAGSVHNPVSQSFLHLVTPHHAIFARLVVLGELGLGALLIVGFLTPLVALLAFFMVASFLVASGQLFTLHAYEGASTFAYLLTFPVLMLGRGGTVLGLDGMLVSRGRKA